MICKITNKLGNNGHPNVQLISKYVCLNVYVCTKAMAGISKL